MRINNLVKALLTGSATLLALPAMAQDAPANVQDEAATGNNDIGSGDIIVTATRQSQVLSKVPISVAAFSQERMDQLSVKDFSQLANLTPGVQFNSGSNKVSIRGVASSAGASTTGIYIDETPVQIRTFGVGAAAALPAVFDLERVEILRGPQGTLFGAGSEGGTVRYITPEPSLDYYTGYGRAELAFTEHGAPTYEGGLALGGPIAQDALGFRVSAWYRKEGGYVDRINYNSGEVTDADANWTKTLVLRAALAWQPVEGLTITPAVNYQKRNVGDTDSFWEARSDREEGVFHNGNPVRIADHDRFVLPSLKAELETDTVLIVSNTSYFDRKETTFYDASIYNLSYFQQFTDEPLLLPTGPDDAAIGVDHYTSPGAILNRQKNFTQEVRFQSADPEAPLTWVVGGFYGKNKQRNVERIIAPQFEELHQSLFGMSVEDYYGRGLYNGTDAWNADTIATDKQLAGFADVTYKLTDTLKINAGVRVAKTQVHFSNIYNGPFNGPETRTVGDQKETPISPKISVSWQATPSTLLYATAAKGFRIGGANNPIPDTCAESLADLGITKAPDAYDSDSVWSYEVGAKGRVLDNRVRYEASAYYIKWSDIQQSVYLSKCGVSYTGNLGQAESKGFDLSVQGQATDALSLELAVGYTNARYTQPTFSAPDRIVVDEGNTLPGVTPWKVVAGARYDFTFASAEAFIRGNVEYSSRNPYLLPGQDPDTTGYDPITPTRPATTFVRVRAGVDLGGVEVSAFVDNLLNSSPMLSRDHQDKFTQLFTQTTFRPRTIGVTASHRF